MGFFPGSYLLYKWGIIWWDDITFSRLGDADETGWMDAVETAWTPINVVFAAGIL